MVPFFADVLGGIVRDLMERIILKDSNLNPNDPKVLAFKKEAGNFLAALLSHLEKSPLKYALVRSAASLNPLNMANKSKRSFCINHFSILLQRLVKVNKISSQSAERAKAQYSSFFDVVDSNVTAFKFHFIENLKEKCLIVLRWVADHMSASEEPPEEVQITRDMLHYVKYASRKCKEDLCQQRQEKENERKSLKHKIVDDEIKQIKAKYRILQGEIEDLTVSADKIALKAEKRKNFTYLTESNKKRKFARRKRRKWRS